MAAPTRYAHILGDAPTSRMALSRSRSVTADLVAKRAAKKRSKFETAAALRAAAHKASVDSTLAFVRAMNPGFRKAGI